MTVRVNLFASFLSDTTASELRALCNMAEDAGIDGLGVGDHVSFYNGAGGDGLLGATSILTASDRLAAMVGVYLLPLRHPVPVARQLADLAAFAPGRLTFGVGIGGEDPHEVEVCGVDPRTRGRRMDEYLTVLRRLMVGESVTFDGDFVSVQDAEIAPAPTEPVPILVGGRSDAAVRRAGRLGDGWLGVWVSARRFARVVEAMSAAAHEAGRGEVVWQNALNVWCGVGETAEEAQAYVAPVMEGFYQTPYEAFAKWSPAGPPGAIAEFLAPYVEAGCETFNLIANGDSPQAEVVAAAEVAARLHA